MFKAPGKAINQFERHFVSADIDRTEYLQMKRNPQECFWEQTMFLCGSRWTLCNPDVIQIYQTYHEG